MSRVSAAIPRCQAPTGKGTPCQRPGRGNGPCAYHDPQRPSPVESWRKWPLSRRWTLMEYLEKGWTDERIATALGTTATAVHLAVKRYRIPARRRTVLTAREIARRLGLGCAKTVVRWGVKGWLRGQRGWQQGPNRVWFAREESVLRFLETPAHWHLYDVDYIADPDWKAYALACRNGVELLRVGEAAQRAYVEIGTVSQWVRKGWVPAQKRGPNWFIRSDDLAQLMARRDRTGSAAIEPAVLDLRRRLGNPVNHQDIAA